MNLVKFLNSFDDSELKNIYSNAIKHTVLKHSGTIEERIKENNEIVETQYCWVRAKRPGVKHTLAAINTTRKVSMTNEEHDEWIHMVRSWA